MGRFAGQVFFPYQFEVQSAGSVGHTLGYYTGNPGSYAQMNNDLRGFNQSGSISSNTFRFFGLSGADLTKVVFANNSTLVVNSPNGTISGLVKDVYPIFQTSIPRLVQDLNTGTGERIDLSVSNYRFDLQEAAANYSVVLDSDSWTSFMNVAYATGTAGSNAINITAFTGTYDFVNGGVYTDANNPLIDIVFAGDNISDANNDVRTVTSVDYVNNIIYVEPNLDNNVNSLISIGRTIQTEDVTIYGASGIQYFPQITDELGNTLTTEDDKLILLG